jgi:hypothetical protein
MRRSCEKPALPQQVKNIFHGNLRLTAFSCGSLFFKWNRGGICLCFPEKAVTARFLAAMPQSSAADEARTTKTYNFKEQGATSASTRRQYHT